MTNSIDDAITRIQYIALHMTGITINSAPDYPVENEEPLPATYTFVGDGRFNMSNASLLKNFPRINVEFHFNRTNLKQAYQQANAVIYEFPRRIADDPTLNGTVETVVSTGDEDTPYVARPFVWREKTANAPALVTHCVTFFVTIKLHETPLATA